MTQGHVDGTKGTKDGTRPGSRPIIQYPAVAFSNLGIQQHTGRNMKSHIPRYIHTCKGLRKTKKSRNIAIPGLPWGGQRGSNARPSEPQSDALPTELWPPCASNPYGLAQQMDTIQDSQDVCFRRVANMNFCSVLNYTSLEKIPYLPNKFMAVFFTVVQRTLSNIIMECHNNHWKYCSTEL